jgi:hypothetical protein
MLYVQRNCIAVVIGAVFVSLFSLPLLAADRPQLSIRKVTVDPDSIDASQWQKAKKIQMSMFGAGSLTGKKLDLELQGVYTESGKVSLLVSWPDTSKSVIGTRWNKNNGGWQLSGDAEDRLAIVWEGRQIKNFATKGCTVLCHNVAPSPEQWRFHTNRSPMFGDLWVWESYRSDPLGHAGDYSVDDDGRKPDKGTGKAEKNINKFGEAPLYMQAPDVKPEKPGWLMSRDKVKIDEASKSTPLWMLTEFSGDFADITSQSRYAGGRWVVMLQRKLDTGSAKDVAFKRKKNYNFGIAIFDNSAIFNSFNNGPPIQAVFD